MQTRRFLIVLAVLLAVVALPATALAGGDAIVVAAEGEEPVDPSQPPVVVEPEAEEPEEQPWTARFLVPAAVVLAVVIFIAVLLYWIVRIKTRYRVVA